MRAKEMLSKLRWDPSYAGIEYLVTYLHRGAPKNERTVKMSEIQEFLTSDFVILRPDGFDSYIPYHRILRIEYEQGGLVWIKRHASE
jgi:uncharacterized protein (UPF0248 family)